jgi:hypothetical protein
MTRAQLDIAGGATEDAPQQPRARPQPDHRRRVGDQPRPVPFDVDRAALDETLDRFTGEERVAVAGGEHRGGERVIRCRRQLRRDQRLGLVVVERIEVERGAPTVVRHPLQQLLDLVAARRLRAERDDGQHRHVRQPRQQRHERQRRAVGDV